MAGSNTQEASDRLDVLRDEIRRLDSYEATLEQHKQARLGEYILRGMHSN